MAAVTVTVDGSGGISITAPTSSTALTMGSPNGTLDNTATAALTETKVTDLRAGTTPWIATVSLPVLTGTGVTTGATITTSDATYVADTTIPVGTAEMATISQKTGLDAATPQTSQATSSVQGNNSAAWTATLTVMVPSETLIDTYTGTLTQSVS